MEVEKEIEAVYSESGNRTFIMENTYVGGELKSMKVVGWYWGEPSDDLTEEYRGKRVAYY